MLLYNLGMYLLTLVMRLTALWSPKSRKWVEGRKDIFERLDTVIKPQDKIFWVHAASLGEFEQGRPVIEEVKAQYPEYTILLTFFSPSGYEIRKGYRGADHIFYLPADTPANMRRFVKIAHPEVAVFVKYEFWLNCLKELRKSGCRTYLVSAIFRKSSVFFRWYGGMFRKCLKTFRMIFVQDESSKSLLANIGVGNVAVAGDTRFDRVAAIHESSKRIPLIDKFKAERPTFIAGSTWGPDEDILLQLVRKHPEMKFIIAPHVISGEHIRRLEEMFGDKMCRFTWCAENPDFDYSDKQVLLIDTIGYLSSAYRYADYAYVGGGFGVGIHNTLEAATFGLPVAFGPNYRKFKEAADLIELGVGCSVSGFGQLDKWLDGLIADCGEYERLCKASAKYINDNKGATDIIMTKIFGADAEA